MSRGAEWWNELTETERGAYLLGREDATQNMRQRFVDYLTECAAQIGRAEFLLYEPSQEVKPQTKPAGT